jgi:hypothetical protein
MEAGGMAGRRKTLLAGLTGQVIENRRRHWADLG